MKIIQGNSDQSELYLTEQEFIPALDRISKSSTKIIPDNVIKLIPDDVCITKESIIALHNQVISKVRTYKSEISINIVIKFINGEILNFTSWESFKIEDFHEYPNRIESIVITWRMKIKFEYINLPQDHALVVKFANGLKPQEMLQMLLLGSIEDSANLESKFQPIVAQSFFTDRTFGNELITVVDKWAKSVKRNSDFTNKLVSNLKKHPIFIAETLRIGTYSIIIYSSFRSFYNYFNQVIIDHSSLKDMFMLTNSKMLKIIFALILLTISLMFAGKLSRWFAKGIFKLIDSYGRSYIFSITKEDFEKSKEFQKNSLFTTIKFIIVVVLNLLVNIFYMIIDHLLF